MSEAVLQSYKELVEKKKTVSQNLATSEAVLSEKKTQLEKKQAELKEKYGVSTVEELTKLKDAKMAEVQATVDNINAQLTPPQPTAPQVPQQ